MIIFINILKDWNLRYFISCQTGLGHDLRLKPKELKSEMTQTFFFYKCSMYNYQILVKSKTLFKNPSV